MAIIDNTLAAQTPQFNPAAPLVQAARIQEAQTQERAAQFKQAQMEIGSEARGLTPFVNTPEFPAKWAETADRMLQKGLLDPQTHQQWRNTPSPLLLKQLIAQTEDPTLSFQKEEAQRQQKNTEFNQKIALRAANRADEDLFAVQQVTNQDGTTSFVKVNKRTGEVAPTGPTPQVNPATNPKSPFNMAMVKNDAERVNSYSEAAKLAEEGGATLDQIDSLRKQAFTAPVIGPLASKVGYPANQALEAATNQLSLDVAQKMKGSLSDKDIAFIKSQVPTASTGGDAGDAASGLIRSGFERTKQRAAFYRTWAEENGGINGADAAWNKYITENPLTMADSKALGGRKFNPDYNKDFSPYIKITSSKRQTGITQAQYDALPSGTPFTAPDGSQRIKP